MSLGPMTRSLLDAMSCLAGTYRCQGRLEEAEKLYRSSLEACQRISEPEGSRATDNMIGLARTYQAQGRFDEAESMARKAMQIREEAAAADDSQQFTSASSLDNLAWIIATGPDAATQADEALSLAQRAVSCVQATQI